VNNSVKNTERSMPSNSAIYLAPSLLSVTTVAVSLITQPCSASSSYFPESPRHALLLAQLPKLYRWLKVLIYISEISQYP